MGIHTRKLNIQLNVRTILTESLLQKEGKIFIFIQSSVCFDFSKRTIKVHRHFAKNVIKVFHFIIANFDDIPKRPLSVARLHIYIYVYIYIT